MSSNNRFSRLVYTLQHRKAFRQVEKELFGRVTLRGYLHDLDKVFPYPIQGKKCTYELHQKHARHYLARAHTRADFEKMAVDWECTKFTEAG